MATPKALGVGSYTPDMAADQADMVKLPAAEVQRCEQMFATLQQMTQQSLLKTFLPRNIFDIVKQRSTKKGANIGRIIQCGLQGGGGIYALDAQSYRIFPEFYYPIIEKFHTGFRSDSMQQPPDFCATKLGEIAEFDPRYVISIRVGCNRMLDGFPSSPLMSEQDFQKTENRLLSVVMNTPDPELKGSYLILRELPFNSQIELIRNTYMSEDTDRYLLGQNNCEYWPMYRGIFQNKEKSIAFGVNIEDHIRVVSIQKGGNLQLAVKRLIGGLAALESKLKFTRDDQLGWLSFIPSMLGTSLRATARVKLPKLGAKKEFKDICEKYNLQATLIPSVPGGTYDVKNKRVWGLSEFDAIKEMHGGVSKLIDLEKSA